jgi:sec-independent protein translocase protein TatA
MSTIGFISPSNVGPWQVLLIVVLIVFLFGGKKIPEISRALGQSLREFKKGREESEKDDGQAAKTKDAPDASKTDKA